MFEDDLTPWEELQHYYERVQELERTQLELLRAFNHQAHFITGLTQKLTRLESDHKALKQYVTTKFRQPKDP